MKFSPLNWGGANQPNQQFGVATNWEFEVVWRS